MQRISAINGETKQRIGRARDEVRDPLLSALTLLLALLIFLVVPLHAAGVISVEGYGIVLVLLLASCILVQSRRIMAVVVMLAGICLAVAGAVVRGQSGSRLAVFFDASAWITIGLALIWVVATAVFAPGRVTYHRINGAVLLYLTIGLSFVSLFTFVGLTAPDAFRGLAIADSPTLASNLIYFSFVTLTSTGYGDIVPVHPLARALCNVEAIIGQLYPATLLARLVTLELEGRRKWRDPGS